MNTIALIQVDAIPFLTLLLILINTFRKFSHQENIRRFQILIGLITCILLVDGYNWYIQSDPIRHPLFVVWEVNIIYFILSEVTAFFWLSYVYYQIHQNKLSPGEKRFIMLSLIPLVIVCLIIAFSPLNHLVFSIDSKTQVYTRGSMHILQILAGFGYMLLASALAYRQSRKVTLYDQKKEYRFLASMAFLPFIGGCLQMLNYYLVFLWPFTSAAVFLMYADFQKHLISVDSLTGLNNRRSMERHLESKIANSTQDWYLVMIDADHFKQINDKYGHMEGDRALKLIAGTLKTVFGTTSTFIARYGGDEFVLITDFTSKIQLTDALNQCQTDLETLSTQQYLPYKIELSAGYARYDVSTACSADALIHKADVQMYVEKQRRKSLRVS